MHYGIDGLLLTICGLVFFSFLPGFLLTHLLFPRDELDWVERVPIGFALCLSLLMIPIVVVKYFGWGWNAFLWIWVAIETAIVITVLVVLRYRAHIPSFPSTSSRTFSLTLFLWILFGIVLCSSSALSVITPRDEDDWSYLADIRVIADFDHFPPLAFERNVLHAWWFLHALLVRFFNVDPVRLVQDWMPLIFVPVALLAFYALARALLSLKLALVASLLQFLFLFLDLFNPDELIPWPGWWVFARIDQDHSFVIFVLLPVFAALIVRFMQKGTFKWLASATLVQFGLVATHAAMGLWLSFLTVGPLLVVSLLFIRKSREYKHAIILAAMMGLVLLIEAPAIVYFLNQFFIGVGARLVTPQDVVFPFNRYRYTYFSPTAFTLRIDFLGQPPVLAAILLTFFLIPLLKQNLTARYLFGSMTGLLLVLYVPPCFTWLESHLGPTSLRFWNWLPKSLVIAFFVPYLYDLVRRSCRAMNQRRWDRYAIATGSLVIIVFLLLGLYPPHLRRDWPPALSLRERLPIGSYELLHALRDYSAPSGGVVLAWRDITDAIPAYGVTLKPVLFRENPQAIERMDADTFYSTILFTAKHLEILEKYNVKYVVIRANQEIISQFDLMPNYFKPLYRGEYGSLYQVTLLSPDPLIEANTIASYGDWDEAIKKYNEVIADGTDDSLAHTGLGIMLELLSKLRLAAREFEQALQRAPNNLQAHYHLAKIYRTLGMNQEAQAHAHAAGRLMENIK